MSRKLSESEKLSALNWAALNAGTSYGKFRIQLSEKEKQRIFAEFAEVLETREQIEQERLKLAQKKREKTKRERHRK